MRHRLVVTIAATLVAFWPLLVGAQGAAGGETTPIDNLSDYALWAIVGGALTSVVTSFINQSHWKSTTKLAVFLVLCCVTAGLDAYFKRELDFGHWSRALLIVVGSGWTTYLATKPAIKQLEAQTTVTKPT